MTKKRKPAKSVVLLQFSIVTLKRLISPEYAQRFHMIFDGVSDELVPTHLSFDESWDGNPRVTLDEIKALDTWIPFSQKRWGKRKKVLTDGDVPFRVQGYTLEYKGRIKGDMSLGLHTAQPPQGGSREHLTWGNGIGVTLYLHPLIKHGVYNDATRLFQNIVEYTQAIHGNMRLDVRTTAKWHYVDDPDYARVYPVEWNGVTIEPFDHAMSGGGPVPHCLPRFNPWINVLGREYVELLGREKLLSLDVYNAREDEGGRVWLQITERPEQMHLPETKEHVERLMESLDAPEVFCREPRTEQERERGVMDYRRPEFDWSEITGA